MVTLTDLAKQKFLEFVKAPVSERIGTGREAMGQGPKTTYRRPTHSTACTQK